MRASDNMMKTTDGMLCMKSDYIKKKAQEMVGVELERRRATEIREDNA